MKRTTKVIGLAGALLFTTPAAADPAPDGAKQSAPAIQVATEMRLAGVAAELELDAAGIARVREIIEGYNQQIAAVHKIIQTKATAVKKALVDKKPDDAQIAALITGILAEKQHVHELERQRAEELRKTLSTRQFAKLLVAWPQIEAKVRGEMMTAMSLKHQQPSDASSK